MQIIQEGIRDSIQCQIQYKTILAKNLEASIKNLKMKRHFIFQHDNNLKYNSNSTKELLQKKKKMAQLKARPKSSKKKKKKIIQHRGPPPHPHNIILKLFWKKEWGKFDKSVGRHLFKTLAVVFKARDVLTEYYLKSAHWCNQVNLLFFSLSLFFF